MTLTGSAKSFVITAIAALAVVKYGSIQPAVAQYYYLPGSRVTIYPPPRDIEEVQPPRDTEAVYPPHDAEDVQPPRDIEAIHPPRDAKSIRAAMPRMTRPLTRRPQARRHRSVSSPCGRARALRIR